VELRQLRYFIAIAEAGNFSRAAAWLHVSQPPLSTQMQRLEKELGVRLLERSNRGAALTAAGLVFLREARTALAALERARSETLRAHRGETGRLAVGFVSIADYGILPPALKSFRSDFPQVEVQLHELTTDTQIRELRAARLDLGIGLAPVDEPDIALESLLREELVLAAPADGPEAQAQGAADLRTLSKASFIVPPRELAPGLYDLIISRCQAAGFAPRITQHARQMQTVIGLVSCGMGVALVPSSVSKLRRPGVRYRPLRGRPSLIEIGILRLRTADNPLRERFAEALRGAAQEARQSPAPRKGGRERGGG
jgi:DNA-binding transcriptional LysR family regulator